MNEQPPIAMISLNYFNCNKDTILLLAVIVPSIIIMVLIVNMFVFGEVNNKYGVCNPVYFFWGNTAVCSKFIETTVKNKMATINTDVKVLVEEDDWDLDDTFVVAHPPPTGSIRQQTTDDPGEFYDISNLYSDFKEKIGNPIYYGFAEIYLAIIGLIHSFNELIILVFFKWMNAVFAGIK
jgi:hypothetical protein